MTRLQSTDRKDLPRLLKLWFQVRFYMLDYERVYLLTKSYRELGYEINRKPFWVNLLGPVSREIYEYRHYRRSRANMKKLFRYELQSHVQRNIWLVLLNRTV